MIPLEIVSDRLKTLRESVGLSQNKLAKLIGLPQSSINRYEHNQSTPSPKTFRWLADFYNVSLDYIYGRTDNPHGMYFDYKPQLSRIDPDMDKFVELCFVPNSPISERLKETLKKMLSEEVQK